MRFLFLLPFLAALAPATSAQGQPDEPRWAGDGDGIVEITNPVTAPCPDPDDPGCGTYGGNTVWHDGNATGDYYVSGGGGVDFDAGALMRLSRYIEMAAPDEFEMRFTLEGGLGVYPFTTDRIISVPFEIWNIGEVEFGEENDPSDDLRMIPFINPASEDGTEFSNWADTFPGEDVWAEGPGAPITDWVYWLMPDRPNGYELFEAAALAAGGPGAIYPFGDDGDTQIDPDPATGEPCPNQGYYVDFCYRAYPSYIPEDNFTFVYPIGRLVIADLAGDGTTPPAGTTIRFYTEGGRPVAAEGSVLPLTLRLDPAYPNPFRTRTTVPFTVERSGPVRLTVHDVLGRTVAVLVDETLAAGPHRAILERRTFGSGVYTIVLEANGQKATRVVVALR